MPEKLNIAYLPEPPPDAYGQERCCLDLYLPKNPREPFPVLVWFHGGGLVEGSRNGEGEVAFARRFAAAGVGVAMVGYRLSPEVKFPVYIQDAARAVRWVMDQGVSLGANPMAVYVGGYSAGGYLAAMLAMDESYFREAGVNLKKIAGFIPMSAQVMTHYNIRKERGTINFQSTAGADEASPIFHLRGNTPPLFLILGDNDVPARLEENQYFAAALRKLAQNEKVCLLVIADRDHSTIVGKCLEPEDLAGPAMLRFMGK